MEKTKAWTTIIFLQLSQDFDIFQGSGGKGQDGFFDSSEEEMAKFLSQWDYSERENISIEEPWGSADYVVEVKVGGDNYILAYNTGLGYAGLHQKI